MTDYLVEGPAKKRAEIADEIERTDQRLTALAADLKDVAYARLAGKLAAVGVMDSEPNIRNKLSRDKFTAVFLCQCLVAIGTQPLRPSDS